MAVDVIEKKKRGLTCAECGASVSAGAEECPECGSSDIKKSLVVVRKSVADTDEEIAEIEDELDDDVEDDEDDDDEDEEDELDEEDDDEDDEDDEDEEDEDEDEDDEDDEPVTKSHSLVGLEALNISTAFAEDIVKAFAKKPSRAKYESVMTEFNNVMDSAADLWFAGDKVSKSSKKAPHISVIKGRVNNIIKNTEGKDMPKSKRPKNFDALDDDTKAYIAELEGGDVEKSISKRADLPEDVRKSLEAADKIVEEREQEKWTALAKSYTSLPGTVEERAKMLRDLSEANAEAFETLKKSLDATQEQLSQSDIFKSYGAPGVSNQTPDAAKEAAISKAMEATPGLTREQAEVNLMGAANYSPTA